MQLYSKVGYDIKEIEQELGGKDSASWKKFVEWFHGQTGMIWIDKKTNEVKYLVYKFDWNRFKEKTGI